MRKTTAKLIFSALMTAGLILPTTAHHSSIESVATAAIVAAHTQKKIDTVKESLKKKKRVFHPPLVSAAIMAMWAKVNFCEEGGRWNVRGYIYSGGLGITNWNWVKYGGQKLFGPAWQATPMQQVYIARRIEAAAGLGNYVPDQYGCGVGW